MATQYKNHAIILMCIHLNKELHENTCLLLDLQYILYYCRYYRLR